MSQLDLSLVEPVPSDCHPATWRALFEEWQRQLRPDFAGTVVVSFVTRAVMRRFYRQWYGEDRATDVLSFRYNDATAGMAAGEILICVPEARAAADKLGTTLELEIATLFVHGLIHLAGRDHATASDRDRFAAITHDIMAKQDLPAVSLWSH